MNVALPPPGRDVGASLQSLQWVVDGYSLVYAAVLITAGGLGDILGSRGVFMAGVGVFSTASLGRAALIGALSNSASTARCSC